METIGARYFNRGYLKAGNKLDRIELSLRDVQGYWSHTLSTAGGTPVAQSNLSGNETIKGRSPKASVAAYKVCWHTSCNEGDVLNDFEVAIDGKVDILPVSLGGEGAGSEYLSSRSAVGSFHAVRSRITVVFSASIHGLGLSTVSNVALGCLRSPLVQ